MKNNNKELLKKHHFWVLFGLVPLFVLIAVLMISSGVGGEIDAREDKIKKAEAAIKSKTNPKPEILISKMAEMVKVVDSKQDVLWKGSFAPQKNLYTSLDSPQLKPIEKLRFGEKIPNNRDEYDELKKREIYTARYAKIAERVSPTQFLGGSWDKILRHVNAWNEVKLTSEQIWLLLEDIWVQESILEAISSVNAQMAEFTRVKYEKNGQVIDDPADKTHQDPLRRKFRSRNWEIELEVVPEGTGRILKGTLINITDKLQLMGVGSIMTLKVWLEAGDRKNIVPFEFKIGGESLAGEGATRIVRDKNGDREVKLNVLDIIRTDDHIIPPGMTVSEIAGVEQVFDARTVPIKMIEDLSLGKKDSRNEDVPLKAPKFFADEAAPASASGGAGGAGGAGGPVSMGGGRGDKPTSGGGFGSGGSGQAPTQTFSGGGTVATVIDANKKRYLEVNDQVRRMPVRLAVITDQGYIQDVLLALANSPLRFQITQVNWNRFRGTLSDGSEASPSSGPPGSGGNSGVVMSGQGRFGDEFGASSGGKSRPALPGAGGGLRPGSNGPSGPGSGFGGGFPFSGGGTGSLSSTVSEAQLTSGLIELRVWGIVSLYMNPEAPPAAADAKKDKDKDVKELDPKDKDGKAKDGKDKDGKDKDVKEMDGKAKDSKDKAPDSKDAPAKEPMPKAPPATDPKGSKLRIRRRRQLRPGVPNAA